MISINLLPPETILIAKQSSRFNLINKIFMGVFLIFVFLASATLIIRILQNLNLQKVNTNLVEAQSRVVNLKDKESLAVVLKQRITSIQALKTNNPKVSIFNLISALVPSEITISSISLDRTGNVTLSGSSYSIDILESLVDSLADKEKNLDLIAEVSLDSLSSGHDKLLRFNLKITPKVKL